MADFFKDGQLDYIQRLNQMYTAFAAGPYNALPLTGGDLTGPVTSSSLITATSLIAGTQAGAASASALIRPNNGTGGQLDVFYPTATFGVASVPGLSNSGRFLWSTRSATGANATGFAMMLEAQDAGTGVKSGALLSISGLGDVVAGRRMTASRLTIGPIAATGNENSISGIAQAQGEVNLRVPGSATFFVTVGASGSATACAMNVGRDTNTGRGINIGGTVNASGADYAEYLVKAPLCGTIAPGQIVGIDAEGKLTDKWDRAITFVSKSTNPCMVGGDTWAQELGARPSAPVRVMPVTEQELVSPAVPENEASGTPAVAAVYRSIVVLPGDTDAAWAAKEAAHSAAVQAFDAALEALRQKVDRIAFAGQVPFNVLGATPGQYIVPVQDGDGIAGMAMDEDDMTLKQYMRSIGQVISIEEDGRARIIVKVA
jgi:hypothetical protein